MLCNKCQADKDPSRFYPDAPTLNKPLCKACINLMRGARKHTHKREVGLLSLEQQNIVSVVMQFQRNKEPYLYLLECNNRYKIGYSTNFDQRVRSFNTASPVPHKIIAVAPGGKQQEATLHRVFNRYQMYGEWFSKEKEIFELFSMLHEVKVFLPGYISGLASSSPSCV